MPHIVFRAFLFAACLFPATTSAQITISTAPYGAWYHIQNQAGVEGYALGQTFVAPDATHTQLDRFSLNLSSRYDNPPADFTTYLARWDAGTSRLSGAPLWTSPVQDASGLPPASSSREIFFDTGGITLTAGQTYAIVALAQAQPSGAATNQTLMRISYPSTYSSGDMLSFASSGSTYASLTAATGYVNTAVDLAFSATFSESTALAVPESAATAATFGLALAAGLFALRWHQHRRSALPAALPPSA